MRKMWIPLFLAIVAGGGVYLLHAKEVVQDNAPRTIGQANIDPAVLAEAMDLNIHAFNLPIPPGAYSLNVWIERWTRDKAPPTIYSIACLGGVSGGTLTVSLPTATHPQGYTNWTSTTPVTQQMGLGATFTDSKSSVSSGFTLPEFDIKKITGTVFIQPQDLVVDRDIPLMALMVNKQGVTTLKTENIEGENEVTYYLRARVSIGKTAKPAIWKDGKIQLESQ